MRRLGHLAGIDSMQKSVAVDLAPFDLAGDSAAIKNDDSIAQPDQFRQLGRAEQNDAPVGGNPADQSIDFALGADIDAACGIVK